jgi:hypothetical protein
MIIQPNCLVNIGIAYLNEENYKASAHYFINALQIYKDIPGIFYSRKYRLRHCDGLW